MAYEVPLYRARDVAYLQSLIDNIHAHTMWDHAFSHAAVVLLFDQLTRPEQTRIIRPHFVCQWLKILHGILEITANFRDKRTPKRQQS